MDLWVPAWWPEWCPVAPVLGSKSLIHRSQGENVARAQSSTQGLIGFGRETIQISKWKMEHSKKVIMLWS